MENGFFRSGLACRVNEKVTTMPSNGARRGLWAVAVLLGIGSQARADDLDEIANLAQNQFAVFVEEAAAVVGYKSLSPAEPLGVTGFDVGVELSATVLDDTGIWSLASSATGDFTEILPVPRLHVHKGLPFNIDVGVAYSAVPDSNITLWGGELKYAFVEGGTLMPALALRGTYATLTGVDQLGMDNYGLELAVSKGLAMLTLYGGIGQQWTTATPEAEAAAVLQEEDVSLTKVYGGLAFSLFLLNFSAEVDVTGGLSTYSAKAGLRF